MHDSGLENPVGMPYYLLPVHSGKVLIFDILHKTVFPVCLQAALRYHDEDEGTTITVIASSWR